MGQYRNNRQSEKRNTGLRAMNSKQLTDFFESCSFTQSYFCGVFSSDNIRLPTYNNETQYFIVINTAPSNHAGIHWISIFKPHNGRCIFIDSLGNLPIAYGSFIDEAFKKIILRTQFEGEFDSVPYPLQISTSNLCGVYCLFFVLFLSMGFDFKFILTHFKNNVFYNDNFIYSWFCKNFHF